MSVFVGSRDVIRASGRDVAEYLQGQLSQDVTALADGDSAWSLVLQPQGRVDALFRITRLGPDTFLLDVDPGWGEHLLGRLRRFLLRMDVDLELERWTHHAYRGMRPQVDAPISADVDWIEPGRDVVGPDLGEPADVERLSLEDFTRLRIEAGVPAMGCELDENTIPAEAGDVNEWVSFTKGCYTGQELVARIDARGSNPPRRLRRLAGPGPAPAPGETLLVDGVDAGALTTVASDGDGWSGLGYLKRAVEMPAEVTTSGGAVGTAVAIGAS